MQTGPITNPADRLCRACAHHRPPDVRTPYAVCRAPAVATDLIAGVPMHAVPCQGAREKNGRCGVEGRWWEPRP